MPRQKMGIQLIINRMSSPKIKRLKTPLKHTQSFKSPDSTLLTHLDIDQQSTISLIKTVTCSEAAQAALINEINKVYKEINSIKQQCKRYQESNRELQSANNVLEDTILKLTQNLNHYQQMYQLELINHQQLRKFYQQREYEWKFIVDQHRKLLEEYDRQNCTSLSKIKEQGTPSLQQQSVHKSKGEFDILEPSVYRSERFLLSNFDNKIPVKPKSSSLQKNNRSSPKLKLVRQKQKQEDYYKQISRLYNEESKFAKKATAEYQSLQKEHSKAKQCPRNAQVDQFVDKVIRKTYYTYKEKCISVAEIESMDDMKKLKCANTSTRQRLIKTVKKLNFELSEEQELKIFCQYVEKAVVDRFKALRGDFAFQFLVDKLKQCQKLALSSNSQLQRLDKEKSNVKDQPIYLDSVRLSKIPIDPKCSEILLTSQTNSVVEKISQKNLQLLLISTIKYDKKIKLKYPDEEVSSHSEYSSSSQKNLSQLIHSHSNSKSPERKYFKFGRRESSDINSQRK